MEPEPVTLAGVRNVPSLAEIEHCAAGKDRGKAAVAGPQVSVAATGPAELKVTVAGVGVRETQGGTLVVGHSAFAGCNKKNKSIGRNIFASRPSISPAGLGLPGGAAPKNPGKLART